LKPRPHRTVVILTFVVVALAAVLVACAGAGTDTTTTLPGAVGLGGTTTPLTEASAVGATASEVDVFSTFKSKDPFIQQALPPTSTTSTTTPPFVTTTNPNVTTTYHTTTTRHTTTTSGGGSTSSTASTTTTVAHLHSLKVLSVGTVSGVAAVTFKVDSTVYKDKHAGDVVSSTWGQIKVVDISVSSKVVTLLHGSESLILSVGQSTFE
jgi:hypothetical protein